jgi:hypothetical protein
MNRWAGRGSTQHQPAGSSPSAPSGHYFARVSPCTAGGLPRGEHRCARGVPAAGNVPTETLRVFSEEEYWEMVASLE